MNIFFCNVVFQRPSSSLTSHQLTDKYKLTDMGYVLQPTKVSSPNKREYAKISKKSVDSRPDLNLLLKYDTDFSLLVNGINFYFLLFLQIFFIIH